jgi:hypothetical protein
MFRLDKQRCGYESGIVYVLEISLEDKVLIKVGVTSRKIEDRVSEILVAIWKKYRVFPQCYVKKYSTVVDPYGMETTLHQMLDQYRYTPEHSFGGSTEMFLVDTSTVVEYYEKVLEDGHAKAKKRQSTRKDS